MSYAHIDGSSYKPVISVIIRAYNAEKTIRDAIDSVLRQSYNGFIEIIVCYDKGSNDHTYNIVMEYASRSFSNRKIIIIEHEHTTPFLALLEGLKKAKGDLVTILDADNIFPKNYIERAVNYIVKTKHDKAFYYTNLIVTNKFLQAKSTINQEKASFRKLLVKNLIDMSTMFISSNCLKDLVEAIRSLSKIRYFEFLYEDYLLSLLAFKMCNPVHIPNIYVIYREHGENITGITYKDPIKQLFSLERSIKTLMAFYYLAGKSLTISQKAALLVSLIYRILLMINTIIRVFLVIKMIKDTSTITEYEGRGREEAKKT